ncbi:MAG: hypothetical protein CMN86_17605, partial [Stappia sp.]|nr:hypothetical protein [Stappia sp.]
MGSEAAREQMVKGRKKLTSWFGFGSKYEDAAEMFSKAANLFKVAKNWDEAAEAFYEIAQCHLKLNSAHEAAEAYKDAAVCYKKTNLGRAIEHYKEAVQIHIDTGNHDGGEASEGDCGALRGGEQPERGDGGLPAGGRLLCGRGRDVPTKPVLAQGGGLCCADARLQESDRAVRTSRDDEPREHPAQVVYEGLLPPRG